MPIVWGVTFAGFEGSHHPARIRPIRSQSLESLASDWPNVSSVLTLFCYLIPYTEWASTITKLPSPGVLDLLLGASKFLRCLLGHVRLQARVVGACRKFRVASQITTVIARFLESTIDRPILIKAMLDHSNFNHHKLDKTSRLPIVLESAKLM